MPTQSALILDLLKNTPIDRLQRAINALADHTLTISLTRQSETEIRALVTNGDGISYGITLTDSLTACSCKDSLYRGGICKHATAVALYVLRSPQPKIEALAPQFPTFHLAWSDGSTLCGDPEPERVQPRFTEGMLHWSETCLACRSAYNQPNPAPNLTLAKARPGWGFAA
jgi:hypothetical protein